MMADDDRNRIVLGFRLGDVVEAIAPVIAESARETARRRLPNRPSEEQEGVVLVATTAVTTGLAALLLFLERAQAEGHPFARPKV